MLDGQALVDVLAASPYGYGWWQGDNDYRVYDKRVENGFIDIVRTSLDAEFWIVNKYLSESTLFL